MKYEKVVNGWDVKVYDPNDYEKPEEERTIILNKKYKTIKAAHEAIKTSLEGHDLTISYSSLRKIGDGSYPAKESQIGRSVKMDRCKIHMKVVFERKYEIENSEKK